MGTRHPVVGGAAVGHGNGSFPLHECTWTTSPGNVAVITCTNPFYSARSKTPCCAPESRSAPVPIPATLVRDAPAGGQPRYPHGSRAARSPGRQHHDDLHARPEPGTGRGPEPGGSDVRVMRAVPEHGSTTPDRPAEPRSLARQRERRPRKGRMNDPRKIAMALRSRTSGIGRPGPQEVRFSAGLSNSGSVACRAPE